MHYYCFSCFHCHIIDFVQTFIIQNRSDSAVQCIECVLQLRLGADFVAAAGVCRPLRLVEAEAARLAVKSISVKIQNIYQ